MIDFLFETMIPIVYLIWYLILVGVTVGVNAFFYGKGRGYRKTTKELEKLEATYKSIYKTPAGELNALADRIIQLEGELDKYKNRNPLV